MSQCPAPLIRKQSKLQETDFLLNAAFLPEDLYIDLRKGKRKEKTKKDITVINLQIQTLSRFQPCAHILLVKPFCLVMLIMLIICLISIDPTLRSNIVDIMRSSVR